MGRQFPNETSLRVHTSFNATCSSLNFYITTQIHLSITPPSTVHSPHRGTLLTPPKVSLNICKVNRYLLYSHYPHHKLATLKVRLRLGSRSVSTGTPHAPHSPLRQMAPLRVIFGWFPDMTGSSTLDQNDGFDVNVNIIVSRHYDQVVFASHKLEKYPVRE